MLLLTATNARSAVNENILLEWKQPLGKDECPYVHRWMIGHNKLGSLRLHHWIGSDDPRAKHDHPWWFMTFVLRGGYTDVALLGDHEDDHRDISLHDHLRAPTCRLRRANHRHTVQTDQGGAWTFMITGPAKRDWGFWTRRKDTGELRFVRAVRYFFRHGHHQCD